MTIPADFRPLEMELEKTLGWNDGLTLNVLEHDTNDGMVFHHERIHSALINVTFDGSLFRLLRTVGPRLKDSEYADELARASHYLFEGSRFAHECAATYLGAMYLATEDERIAARSRLPDQYQTYYSFMSTIVDDHCESSFLRYLIAQSISYFWFSSAALMEFALKDFRGPVIMRDEFCPDWRARASASWLSQTGVRNAISASAEVILKDEGLCRAMQIFDLNELKLAWNEDSWWMSQDGPTAGYIEELISETTFLYFLEHSGLNSAPAEFVGNTDLSETLVKPLYERVGMGVTSINGGRRKSPHAHASLSFASREFIVVARTVSHIQPRIAALSVSAVKKLKLTDIDAFVRRDGLIDIVFPEEGSRSTFFNEFEERAVDVGHPNKWGHSGYNLCTPQLASEVLRRIMRQQILGQSGRQVDCVVVPANFDDHFSTYNELLRLLSDPSNSATTPFSYGLVQKFSEVIGREFLYAYIRDDWMKIVGNNEPKRPRTHIGFIRVNLNDREPFLLNVARIDGFPSTLLKAYPMHAAPVIVDYYRSCIELGHLHNLEDEHYGAALLESSRRAFVSVTAFWHQL